MCEVLGIARASYYKISIKDKLPRAIETRELKNAIKNVYDESEGNMALQKFIKF